MSASTTPSDLAARLQHLRAAEAFHADELRKVQTLIVEQGGEPATDVGTDDLRKQNVRRYRSLTLGLLLGLAPIARDLILLVAQALGLHFGP